MMQFLKDLQVFILGMIESKSDTTTHFDGFYIEVYDSGRAFGRKLLGLKD